MDSFFLRFKNPLVLISIVLLQVIALAVQLPAKSAGFDQGGNADGRRVTMLRRWTVAVVSPVERGVDRVSLQVRSGWSNYIFLRGTRQENDRLKQQVARLREEQAAFAEDAAQGRRLQQLLAFKQQYIQTTVAAQVIGTSGSDRSRVLYLDKGSDDGLRPQQAVMTPDGVVGKLRDVFPHTSQVLLLSDATSGAGVILLSSRMRGILRGTATGEMEIDNLTADSRIKPGEKIVTSGGDMVFPRGLPVGEIVSIAPDPQHQPYSTMKIRPWANLSQLEEVLVITGTASTLPAAAASDAATAEDTAAATAEANKRAADMVADRLPNVHQDELSDDTEKPAETQYGGVAGIPNSGMPRAKPVVHPDKYSPGVVAPAADLQPGAAATPQTSPPETVPPPQ